MSSRQKDEHEAGSALKPEDEELINDAVSPAAALALPLLIQFFYQIRFLRCEHKSRAALLPWMRKYVKLFHNGYHWIRRPELKEADTVSLLYSLPPPGL